jgi:CopG family transcriptional regulator / antitoxin EndoAI
MDTQSFNIVLPLELVKKVDAIAKKEYRNRSELIREALRIYLKDEQEWEDLFAYGAGKRKKLKLKNENEVDSIVASYRHKP